MNIVLRLDKAGTPNGWLNREEAATVVADIEHQVVNALQRVDRFNKFLFGRRAMQVEGHVANVARRRVDHLRVLHHCQRNLLLCHGEGPWNCAAGIKNRESMGLAEF